MGGEDAVLDFGDGEGEEFGGRNAVGGDGGEGVQFLPKSEVTVGGDFVNAVNGGEVGGGGEDGGLFPDEVSYSEHGVREAVQF